MTRKLKI